MLRCEVRIKWNTSDVQIIQKENEVFKIFWLNNKSSEFPNSCDIRFFLEHCQNESKIVFLLKATKLFYKTFTVNRVRG